ncbi:MAG TPA: flagellar hook-basal body complex protein FliE [Gammaproteobacteria bacterium]|nr:flagellar hook-basal body complex protein FliE [Gammaproteobacteria bacterium]
MSSNIDVNQILAQMRAMAAASQGTQPSSGADAAPGADFASLLKQSVDSVNETQQQAGKLTDAFVKGDPNTNLSEVMVAVQKAGLSFEAMTQVRNKLVAAYQEVMNMQA